MRPGAPSSTKPATAVGGTARAGRPRLEKVRITKVGLLYIVVTLVVGVAAANTGNNALYLAESTLLAVLAISGLVSRRNLKSVEIEVSPPAEVFARQPFTLSYRVSHRDRLMGKRLLEVSSEGGSSWRVPHLERGGSASGGVAAIYKRRGRHRVEWVRVSSIFPLGLFWKAMRARIDLELLVFPELYPTADSRHPKTGRGGDRSSRRRGWGHELRTLRWFRTGDDPRAIHWKQSARTQRLVYMEREVEEGRRLSILFDNGVGPLTSEAERQRFERLVSEAASGADHHLARGFEVELVTRDGVVPFAGGPLQRLRILEVLALVEPAPASDRPLKPGDRDSPRMRLGLDRGVA